MNFTLIGIIAFLILITILFFKFKSKQPSLNTTKKEERAKLKEIKKLEKKDKALEAKHKKVYDTALEIKKSTTTSHNNRKSSMSDLVKKR